MKLKLLLAVLLPATLGVAIWLVVGVPNRTVEKAQAAPIARFFDTTCFPTQQPEPRGPYSPPGRPDEVVIPQGYVLKSAPVLNDDPLKFPGQPGAAHKHTFTGAVTINASSLQSSNSFPDASGLLADNADQLHTTCNDTRDGSGYWTPQLLQCDAQGNNCVEITMRRFHIYYFCRTNGEPCNVQPFPVGWGQIAGSGIPENPDRPARDWRCVGVDVALGSTLPEPFTCPTGNLRVTIDFAECWDGVNKFKPDESHVAYPVNKQCSDGVHTVRVPNVTLQEDWNVDTAAHVYKLVVGADGSLGSTGTAHADFVNVWQPAHLQDMIDHCLNVANPPPGDPGHFQCNRN